MVNYYDILGVSQAASEEDIKAKLKEKKRIWTQRQNAPRPEQQQEASNNLRMVPDIEATLLNVQKRSEYNQKLHTAPKETGRIDTAKIETEDLIQEGWQLLAVGNVPDALLVATRATEKQGGNPDAWALLGYCKAQWGETEDAIYEYKRAIRIRPNDASFYFDLGGIYEGIEHWKDAMQQYERASQIDPSTVVYRAAMGSVFIKNDMYDEGIDILDKCLQAEPDNEGYKYLLAIAYAESGYQNWTFVPEDGELSTGYYATTDEQVRLAEQLVEKAEQIGISDSDLVVRIQEIKENIASMRKRRFHGNRLAAGGAIVIALIALFSGERNAIPPALFYLISGVLYILSCMTPQYRLNRRLIEGRAETSSGFISEMSSGEGGWIGWIIGLIIILTFLPIMTLWNFIKNYAFK